MKMSRALENDHLIAEIADQGAQLIRLYDKDEKREVLWEGDPKYWGWHSPLLFPNVGGTFQNVIHCNGREYPAKRHGFARHMRFDWREQGRCYTIHRLTSDAATRQEYPFLFELTVTHRLNGRNLTVEWQVENSGVTPMYFTIGGHPAFRLPGNGRKEAFSLRFPGLSQLNYHLLSEGGTAEPEVYVLKLPEERLPLSDRLFERDALILDDAQVQEVQLCWRDGTPLVKLSAPGFSHFGIWSVSEAPFVCLEPWLGRCDNTGFTGDISEKPGICRVEPHQKFKAYYTIEVIG